VRAAGLQQLSTLQQLELLDIPCNDPHAVAHLAVQLPCLRDLDLRCSSAARGNAGMASQRLSLAAAKELTHFRLHVSPADPDIVRHLQWPPQLQVLLLSPTALLLSTCGTVYNYVAQAAAFVGAFTRLLDDL
jgi:hypothetical protein